MIPAGQVIAVIPARGGSKGIPGKNLKKVGGIPLVGRSVRAACGSTRVGAVYVSSDDLEILSVGQFYGAIPIQRPADISGDRASSEAALIHAIQEVRKSGSDPLLILLIQCTSPFLTSQDIDKLVEAMDTPGVCAALTVTADHGFLWKRTQDGFGVGINHDEKLARLRRQELEPQFRENGAAYAMKVEPFLAMGRRFCGPVAVVETDMTTVEIDSPDDLVFVEALARFKEGAFTEVPKELAKIRALVTDFDGVHTNDTVVLKQDGTESVICSRSDGMGIAHLKKTGCKILILSKEKNPVVTARANKLGVECLQGIDNKLEVLQGWAQQQGLTFEEIAYVGNDVNDLECLRTAGLAISPADAHPDILTEVDWVLKANGGRGAVREVCDAMLKHSGDPRG